jgi:S-adenosylmethionine:diacylglycerol 3-amino-3-carboxypropyl transferase
MILILVGVILVFGGVVFLGAPYVPTRRAWAKAALSLVKIGQHDTIVDLGSGDGAILKLAAARGAQAIGYEINPILVLISRLRLAKFGALATVKMANYWQVDLPAETTVVYVFGVSRHAKRMANYLTRQRRRLGHPIKIICFGPEIPRFTVVKSNSSAKLYEI